jgi:hypothetical protein
MGSLTGLAIIGIIITTVLVAVDPQKQMRIANCVQNCQTTTDPLACQENCK